MIAAVKNMSPRTKTYAIIGLVALVVLVSVAIYFYKKGKKQVSVQVLPYDVAGEPTGTGQPGTGNGISNNQIKVLVQKLYDDMSGFNWSGHDQAPYQEMSTLSDTDFVRVYNLFNTLYQKESEQTLREWIDNEKYAFSFLTDSILQRMAKLNLV